MRIVKRVPLPPSAVEARERAVRDFRVLANVLRAEGECLSHGTNPGIEHTIQIAGWTIYQAEKDGLLTATIDLQKLTDGPDLLADMDKGGPKLLQRPDQAGSPIRRDVKGTIAEYLDELELRIQAESTEKKERDIPDEATFRGLAWRPDEAAAMLVSSVWRTLASKFMERLPDDIARRYVGGNNVQNFFLNHSNGGYFASFVCSFIGDSIAREIAGDSTGWLTITDAATLTGIVKGSLSRSCDDKTIETNNQEGPARRISTPSLIAFMKTRRRKRRESSADLGWECRQCSEPYKTKPSKCKKCDSSVFEPQRPQP